VTFRLSPHSPSANRPNNKGVCLEPHDLAISKHDLAISKYAARREKDIVFTRELAGRGIVSKDRLLALLDQTSVSEEVRRRIRAYIAGDFAAAQS
jgi:hypothetical protein